jgi:hypothetical protein
MTKIRSRPARKEIASPGRDAAVPTSSLPSGCGPEFWNRFDRPHVPNLVPVHIDDPDQLAARDADRMAGLGGNDHRPASRIWPSHSAIIPSVSARTQPS